MRGISLDEGFVFSSHCSQKYEQAEGMKTKLEEARRQKIHDEIA